MMADSMLFAYLVVCIKLVKTPCIEQKNMQGFTTQQDLNGNIWRSSLKVSP